ncbi:serine hydrolase [Pedobacter psychrodurus]|uniref:Serine hydrolase n=1 Tax=Pedobacter psychrodurus TaxID=2530456 RepID=A0A4R0PUW2_9SPHI|nr:serine hydrolase [Pedobacter psychrodurus]TCD23362.1 serine hydrolase [Pedobacter psychrodurus]
MKKSCLAILFLLSTNIFAQKPSHKFDLFENSVFHWDKSKNKKWTLKERMNLYGVNAVSIAVVKDYKIEWTKAYGFADVDEKKMATPEILFQAGSISKSINSLGILKLVEEGKLALYDDINNYLKTWKFPYDDISNGKKISIADLLSHKAGLSVHGFYGYEIGRELPSTIQILDGLQPANSKAVRSEFEPGLNFEYSGGGTTITQLIIENTSGQTYEDYMSRNILVPLGMSHSSFNQPPIQQQIANFATGYNNGKEVIGKYHIYPEKAAAGLWTNPTDIAKYIIETQLSLSEKSNKILSKEMSLKRLENSFGVFLDDYNGVKYFRHSGGSDGFVCNYVASLNNGDGIIVMTNGMSMRLIDEIVNSIASINNWKNYPLIPQKESIALAIRKECEKNIDQGIELYKNLKKDKNTEYNFLDESELNTLAYEFLRDEKIESAIKLFNINVNAFPNSPNVYDSRAEAYFNKKDYFLSKSDYLKVLELDSANLNAKNMLLKIEKLLKN